MYIKKEDKITKLQDIILSYEVDNLITEVDEDIFENSIKMSYKYLDEYYLQTREQAKKGFFITVFIAVFGAVLIFIGIGAIFMNKTNPAFVTSAAGILTEFISSIFFFLYNRTITSMRDYHNKLVTSQNISIALKVSDSLPSDDQVKAKQKIIEELMKNINIHIDNTEKNNLKY